MGRIVNEGFGLAERNGGQSVRLAFPSGGCCRWRRIARVADKVDVDLRSFGRVSKGWKRMGISVGKGEGNRPSVSKNKPGVYKGIRIC